MSKERDVFGKFEVDGQVWGALFPVDPELERLKTELAELDSAIFNFTKTRDLRGSAYETLELMRKRRTALEDKIENYKV
jgi:uncharacterized protein YdcH (DUF465 family)